MLVFKKKLLRMLVVAMAAVMIFSCFIPVASAEDDNIVRVLLTRLGSRTSISMELTGSYVVNGHTLADGTQVNAKLSGGKISVSANGTTLSTASTVTLSRTGTGVTNGLRFTSPSLTNLYCGDLVLKSSGGYIQPVLNIDVETYLYGVVPYEIGNSSPLEAQKAQAVAARTFAMRAKKTTGDYDLYDNANSQVFKGYAVSYQNAKQAVDATCGVVLKTVGGNYAQCYYTASNGGQTESTKNAWGGEVSYLTVKDDPYDYESPSAKVKSVTINKDGSSLIPSMRNTILSAASSQLSGAGMSGASVVSVNSATLSDPRYAAPSRLYSKLTLNVTFHSASKAATFDVVLKTYDSLQSTYSLSINSSDNEVVWIRETDSAYILEFKRFGHGIGMSQCGAMVMASSYNMTYAQILDFYYTGTVLSTLSYANTVISAPQEIIVNTGVSTGTTGVTTYPTMRYGDKNDGVKQLQATLKQLGYFNNDITGNYYSATEAAVRAFQSANGLTVDGIAGPQVQAKLFGTSTIKVTTPTEQKTTVVQQTVTSGKTLKYGDKGNDVVDLQNKLKKLGYFNETSTGNYYSVTEAAVKTFQSANGYTADGIATQELLDKIDEAATKASTTVVTTVTDNKKAIVTIGNSSSYLNMRSQPSTNSSVLTTLGYGTEVDMISDDGEWMHIQYGSYTGYVSSQYMRVQENSTTTPVTTTNNEKTATVATESDSYLNIRTAANTSADKLGQLNCGTRVTVISEEGDWTKISYNGITGYVFNAYLRKD